MKVKFKSLAFSLNPRFYTKLVQITLNRGLVIKMNSVKLDKKIQSPYYSAMDLSRKGIWLEIQPNTVLLRGHEAETQPGD